MFAACLVILTTSLRRWRRERRTRWTRGGPGVDHGGTVSVHFWTTIISVHPQSTLGPRLGPSTSVTDTSCARPASWRSRITTNQNKSPQQRTAYLLRIHNSAGFFLQSNNAAASSGDGARRKPPAMCVATKHPRFGKLVKLVKQTLAKPPHSLFRWVPARSWGAARGPSGSAHRQAVSVHV